MFQLIRKLISNFQMFLTDLESQSSIQLDAAQNELAKTFVAAFYKAQETPNRNVDGASDPLDSLDDDVFAQFEELGSVDQSEYLDSCFSDSDCFEGSVTTTTRYVMVISLIGNSSR